MLLKGYKFVVSGMLAIALLFSVAPPLSSQTLEERHSTLERYFGVGSWEFDTGELCVSLGIKVCARAYIGVGGDLLTVAEDGSGILQVPDEYLSFEGDDLGGQAAMNFGAEAGVTAKICFLGSCYEIPLPYIAPRDFLLSDQTSWTPYFPGQTIKLSDDFQRQEIVCGGVDVSVASGELCLEGSASAEQILTPSYLKTSVATFIADNQKKPVPISCPAFEVSRIRKDWDWNGDAALSIFMTGRVCVLGVCYDIPLPIIQDFPLPIGNWLTASFETIPYQSITFQPIPDIGRPNISGLASRICGGDRDCFSASATGSILSWKWTSSCGGKFTNPTGSSTCWDAPTDYSGNCEITVTATGVCGSKSSSELIEVIEPPGTPDQPGASPSPVCVDTQYCVSWNRVSNATSYEISENNGPWQDIGNTTSKCYSKSSAGTYCYRVRAKNACGTSNPSGSRCVTVNPVPSTPSTPVIVPSRVCVDSQYCVSWGSVSGATSFEISENNGPWQEIGNTTTKCYSKSSAETYCYRVRAKNSCGISNSSGSRCVTVVDSCVSACPSDPVCFNFTPNTDDSYSIVIDSAIVSGIPIDTCDEIAVFDGNLCVGASVFDGTWPVALAAWGDDSQTGQVDGYQCGNEMSFKIARHGTCEVIDVCIDRNGWTQGDGAFCTGFAAQGGLTDSCGRCLTLSLGAGWNFVSTNVCPDNLDPQQIFAPIWSEMNIIKQCDGVFCVPGVICNLNQIDCLQGYKIHMKSTQSVDICGTPIDPSTPIVLHEGWNCISYLPRACLAPEDALVSIERCLDIIKDGDGGFYIPGVINSMGNMCPGEGYSAHLRCPDTLIYPQASPVLAAQPKSQENSVQSASAAHFDIPKPTSDFHPVVVLSSQALDVGDEVAIVAPNGDVIGAARVQGERTPVPVWVDDELTDQIDGYLEGDRVTLQVWKQTDGREVSVKPKLVEGSLVLSDNPYTVLTLDSDGLIPEAFGLSSIYPNPANPTTTVEFNVPAMSDIELTIFNVLGQKVRTLYDGSIEVGHHSITWDGKSDGGTSVASGVYFFRLTSEFGTDTRKMILMK